MDEPSPSPAIAIEEPRHPESAAGGLDDLVPIPSDRRQVMAGGHPQPPQRFPILAGVDQPPRGEDLQPAADPAAVETAIEAAVAETGAAGPKDMGKVMKAALGILQAGGKPADGKKVSDTVKKRLGG